jgi:hypothetical protein
MLDGKKLSEMIRKKKKKGMHSDYRQDMDYAGQDAVDPNVAWDEKQNMEVNEATGDMDHEPASPSEMGENESSQDKMQLKKAMARIAKYIERL